MNLPVGWPEPLEPPALHGLAGEIVTTIAPHTEADPVALLVQFLLAFGNVVGRSPHFTVEADYHRANLFAVLVGETSKGRKGTSWGHVRRLFELADPEWALQRIQSGLSSGEGLIWAVRDPTTRYERAHKKDRTEGEPLQIVDPGVADKRLLDVESEFSSLLCVMRREGNNLSQLLRQAWETGTLRSLTKNAPAVATGAHISVIGHITREELCRHLNETEAANGFGNRFLWLCVKRSKVLPEGGSLQTVDVEGLVRRLGEAVRLARHTGELRRGPEAVELWSAVYPDLSEGKLGLFGAITSRAEAQSMRLALIYALLDRSTAIGRTHLEAALAVWKYCDASCRFIFGSALGDPIADQVLTSLRDHPQGLHRNQLWDLFARHLRPGSLDRALRTLTERGLAHCVREGSGGRPAERWLAMEPANYAK